MYFCRSIHIVMYILVFPRILILKYVYMKVFGHYSQYNYCIILYLPLHYQNILHCLKIKITLNMDLLNQQVLFFILSAGSKPQTETREMIKMNISMLFYSRAFVCILLMSKNIYILKLFLKKKYFRCMNFKVQLKCYKRFTEYYYHLLLTEIYCLQ